MKIRLFIAINLPNEHLIQLKNYILAFDKKVEYKWEKLEKFHITLKFLGDVPINKVDEIIKVLENITLPTFNIAFSNFGLFYKDSKPSILWLGIKESAELNKLKSIIDENLFGLGFDNENRNFKPHITILRLKQKNNLNKIKSLNKMSFNTGLMNIKEFSLIKSELKRTGSIYTDLKKFKLKIN